MTDISLEDHLANDPDITEDPEHFEILDDSAAAWAMRKLRRIRRQQTTNQAIAEAEIDKVRTWLTEVNRTLEQSGTYFEAILSHYALRCRQNPEDGRKSISLPAGKIATRVPPPSWHVDPVEFIPWAETNRPDLLRVKVDPALSEIKRAFAPVFEEISSSDVIDPDSGEMIPGLRVSPSDLTTTVTPDLD